MKNKINRYEIFILIAVFVVATHFSYAIEGSAYAKAKLSPGEITFQMIRIGNEVVYEEDKVVREMANLSEENSSILVIIRNSGESDLKNLHIEYSLPEGIEIKNTFPKKVDALKKDESVMFKSVMQMKKGVIADLKISGVSDEREKSVFIKINKVVEEQPPNLFTRQNILIIMGIILLLVLVTTAYALWPRMKPEPRVAAYIRECRYLKMSDEEIAQSLLENGWKEKIVRKHLKIVK